MRISAIFFTVFLLGLAGWSYAAPKCDSSQGEAAISNNDVPSARAEAISRAKWAAIENIVGVEVKANSIVQNMALVDEAVNKEVGGVVKDYSVLSEKVSADTVSVRIKACVEPLKAEKAISSLSLNNSIVVFTPLQTVSETGGKGGYEESNPFSEALISSLIDSGYKVIDIAQTHAADVASIETALKNENFLSLRGMLYKFLANIMIIGKVDYTVSTKKSEDIGYGVKMPFNNVTVRLVYRVVTRDSAGNMIIVTSGTKSAKGMAGSVEDAVHKGLTSLSEQVSVEINTRISEYVKGSAKRIMVKISGVSDINTNFEVKDMLTNTVWVTKVDEQGIGEFIVKYIENPVYLANSLNQKPGLAVTGFTPGTINVRYSRQ